MTPGFYTPAAWLKENPAPSFCFSSFKALCYCERMHYIPFLYEFSCPITTTIAKNAERDDRHASERRVAPRPLFIIVGVTAPP